jgi:hypothetical protein
LPFSVLKKICMMMLPSSPGVGGMDRRERERSSVLPEGLRHLDPIFSSLHGPRVTALAAGAGAR